MRLLSSRSRLLEPEFHSPPKYAIVSHRWGLESEEVLFTDIGDATRIRSKRKGYAKIEGACIQAMQDELNYVWLDTCCIDKSNNTELCTAINAMYKWYQHSDVCYVYLHDVSDLSEFTKSDWFSRGWTLQELIAPKKLKFFTKEWHFLGTREDLMDPISETTGICHEVLRSANIVGGITISQKMCWAARRQTARVEDVAYSLLGLLDACGMTPVYGIDHVAFELLQFKIIEKSSDQTLFSWYHISTQPNDKEKEDADPDLGLVDNDTPLCTATGLLAYSPSCYLKSYEISEKDFRQNYVDRIRDLSYRPHFFPFNNLIRILLPVKHVAGKIWKAVLRCSFEPPDGDEMQRPLVIYLKEIDHWKYVRVHLAPDREEQYTSIRIRDKGIPGSLERLRDAELQLTGYSLREIDVLSRYGEPPQVLRRKSLDLHAETPQSLKRKLEDIHHDASPEERGYERQELDMAETTKNPAKPGRDSETEAEFRKAAKRARVYLENVTRSLKNDIRSSFPPDLTGHVTRSEGFMFASGFGDIYQGSLDMEGKSIQVAIKRYGSFLRHDEYLDQRVKQFRKDIVLWLKLDHSNILPLYGTIMDPSLHPQIPALVSPCAENGALSTYLDKNNDLTIPRRLDLINDVALGLQYLHSQHLVHGDLSESNILVYGDGSACIANFGFIALRTGTLVTTTTGQVCAMRWMAPELLDLEDSQMPTRQSDVYSFGCIMLQILTGRIPYDYLSGNRQVIIAIVKEGRPRFPDHMMVTNKRRKFMEWCWSSAESRPSSDQIVEFSGEEIAESEAL